MRKFTTCLLSIVVFYSVVSAETYTYLDPSPTDNYTLTDFGDQAKFTFNTDTQVLDFEIQFDKSVLRPDGFQIVISHGPAPDTTVPGEQAVIFFDASTPGQPRLTAYGYNSLGMFDPGNGFHDKCGNGPGSYDVGKWPAEAPDQIKSINDTTWILDTTDSETATHRILGGSIHVGDIINHTPLYPHPTFSWNGIGFEQTIGIWMWGTVLSNSPAYDANGYLTSWPSQDASCIFYDFGDKATNKGPVCTGANIDIQTNVGAPVDFTINAVDADGDDLTVSYMGIPSGAVVTPSAGTQSPPIDVNFSWTPGLADADTVTNFKATFSDSINPPIDCPAVIRVPQDQGPICQISNAQENVECAGPVTIVEFDGLKSSDPEGDPLMYSWSIECNGAATLESTTGPTTAINFTGPDAGSDVECAITLIVSDGLQSSSCKATASVNACPECSDSNVADTLGLLDGNTFTMSKIVKNAASELKRVTGRKVSRKVRDQVRQAKALHIDAWQAINQVPTVIQSCTNASACVSVSHAGSISAFRDDSTDLLTLIRSVTKQIKRALRKNPDVGNRRRWKRFRKRGVNLNNTNQAEAAALPEVNTVCPE